MNRFVIVRDDGKYVARFGSTHSYTTQLQAAQVFSSKDEADHHCCSNESVVPLDSLFGASSC